jgi:acyl-CoA synthetase (AMP-forming)/AMP-acid ligase II
MGRVGTFWDLLDRRVEATPTAMMLIDGCGQEITYAAYREAAERAATGLFGLGVRPGSRVALQLPTRVDTIVLMGALARLGAIQSPLVPAFRETEVAFCLDETQAEFLCVPAEADAVDYEGLCESSGRDVHLLRCGPTQPEGDPSILPAAPVEGDAIRWVYYTSGTTSRPKGALHSDVSVATASAGLIERHQIVPSDTMGMAFPFMHVGGLMNLLSLFQVGHRLVIMEAFEVKAAVSLFAKHDVSVIGGGPVFYAAFLEEQRRQGSRPILPNFRLFSGGGAPMPSNLHYDVMREMGGRGCLHGFGMTECGIVCSNDVDDLDERLANTDGRPGKGVELRVRLLAGSLAVKGQEGEVEIRGPAVCRGYLDPAASAAAFGEDGWFRTGDMGCVDSEGYLTITGRLKDIIIRKGENISANEIEDILYAHAKVADAAVIGLPDPTRGELVCAVVTVVDGVDALGFEEMVEHFRRARVMAQKIPERLEVIDRMPRNPTGKILKQELRARFEGSTAPD